MNHYDDLQRFKEKTRNQKYDFKDLSAQNLAPEQGNWAIMNQLAPASEESILAMGGHVSLPQPQAVDPEFFGPDENVPPPPVSTEAPVAAAHSIFADVAGQLAAHPVTPVVSTTVKTPEPVPPVYTTHVAPAPAAEPTSYARLFAPKAAEAHSTEEKNQPLQSLLERIASCR